MSRIPPGDSLGRDFHNEAEHRRLEQEARRAAELIQQTLVTNSPEARIRIWEQRHQITLPRNPEHQLIDVIADATALTRAQVLEEQRLRAEVRATTRAGQMPAQPA
jgi:hypothetical protein